MFGLDAPELGTFVVQSTTNQNNGRRGNNHQNRGGQHAGHHPAEFSAGRLQGGLPNPTGYGMGVPMWPTQQQPQTQQFSPVPQRGGARATHAAALPTHSNDFAGGDDIYEVHDNQLKAPVTIRRQDVEHTAGSLRLFSTPAQLLNTATANQPPQRNAPRICEAFQQGICPSGDECPDVHVSTDILQSIRTQMVTWLMSKENEFMETARHAPETSFRVFAADLKEVVDVPIASLTFTRGLYVDPSARAKRSRYGQQSAFALMAAQVPTACGLHSVDPAQCKWGRWCNQAHIDPAWMRSKRGEFENWSRSLEQKFEDMPDDQIFVVHDPQMKTSLQVPKMAIAGFSRGLFQGNPKKAPSVCMLYQRGRCTAGSCCNQIHVFLDYLQLLRQYTQDPSPELFYTMQQVAAQQKQLFLLQQQQQSQQQTSAAASLNPGARPFVPPGMGGVTPAVGIPVGFPQGMSNYFSMMPPGMLPLPMMGMPAMSDVNPYIALEQQLHHQNVQLTAHAVLPPSVHVDPGVLHNQSKLPPLPPPVVVESPPPAPFVPSLLNVEDVAQGEGKESLQSSPHLGPSLSASTTAVRMMLSHSPYKKPTDLADLRGEYDEVYDGPNRVSNNSLGGSAALQNSFSFVGSPYKRNHNPYATAAPTQPSQKPIGVPPSPLHAAAAPPVGQNSNPQPMATPPMNFSSWAPPPVRIPPSPFRSAGLKSPTSPPQLPAPFTPDLSHMQFSASPLLRSADSLTGLPFKGLTLEDDFSLQQSLRHQASGGMHDSMNMSASQVGLPQVYSQGGNGGPQLAGMATVTNVRQSQPYQQPSTPNLHPSGLPPSRPGNSTPVHLGGSRTNMQ